MFKKEIGLFILLSQLVSVVLANDDSLVITHKRDVAHVACGEVIGRYASYSNNRGDSNQNFCNVNNQPALGSMAHCLVDSFENSNLYVNSFIESCKPYGLTQSDFYKSYNNASKYLVDVTSKANSSPKKTYPIKVSKSQVQQTLDRVYKSRVNYNYSVWFGIALVSYWFFIMAVACLVHWSYFLAPNLIKSLHGPISNFIRAHIILAPTGSKSHAHAKCVWYVEWLVPTRLESVVVFGWLVLTAVFCGVGIYQPTDASVSTAVGYRSGILIFFSIPVLILLSGRNNFLQWVTGWPYSRFLVFHRWIARIIFVLVIVHWISFSNSSGASLEGDAVTWGNVAAVVGCIIMVQSLYTLRKRFYELFLLVHIILAIIFIAGCWNHTAGIGYEKFLYAAVAVWGFDRVVRIIRLISFGIQEATVELKADETLKVTVNRPSYWNPTPGSHAFIHFMKPTYFWQSHPFTLVDSVIKPDTITFYMKVKGGMTHSLYQHLSRTPELRDRFRVLVEGPYSRPIPIHKFDNAVFLAGGNGIPGLYCEAYRFAEKARHSNKKIKLYWVIRHYKSIDWFYEELLKLDSTIIQPIIYVTQPSVPLQYEIALDGSSSNSVNFERESKRDVLYDKNTAFISNLKKKLSFVEFREGRPNISDIIKIEIAQSSRSIAFATCSHPSMVDQARLAIIESLKNDTSKRIELFEQIQGW